MEYPVLSTVIFLPVLGVLLLSLWEGGRNLL